MPCFPTAVTVVRLSSFCPYLPLVLSSGADVRLEQSEQEEMVCPQQSLRPCMAAGFSPAQHSSVEWFFSSAK